MKVESKKRSFPHRVRVVALSLVDNVSIVAGVLPKQGFLLTFVCTALPYDVCCWRKPAEYLSTYQLPVGLKATETFKKTGAVVLVG